jgi:hypothetical protein
MDHMRSATLALALVLATLLHVPTSATASRVEIVECEDGDPGCDADARRDGACTFAVSPCVVAPAPGGGGAGPPKCARGTAIVVPFRRPRRGSAADVLNPSRPMPIRLLPGGKRCRGRAATNRLHLVCVPPPPGIACPPNPVGPNEVRVTVAGGGTDLDNGWRGASQNFPIPAGTQVQLCLKGCDASTDPECDLTLNAGPGTFNGETLSAPLPLVTAGVPVCVLTRYRKAQFTGGKADLRSGEVMLPIQLAVGVYLTDAEHVCPKCSAGRCDSGPNRGGTCRVDGTVRVSQSTASDKSFPLSKDCPPDTSSHSGPALGIDLPLTTGTSTLSPVPGGNAATPCVKQAGEPTGLQPEPDLCPAGGTCTATCTGLACETRDFDYATGAEVCVDSKGGVSQLCCSNATNLSCFPTRPGSAGRIERTGRPLVPQPAWPDPTYPKRTECTPGSCLVQVATFCEAATGGNSVDGIAGLPGPGALVLPVTTLVLRDRGDAAD